MTPESKKSLSATIRALRTRLLDDLHAATESAYRLSVRPQEAGLNEANRVRRARLDAWIAEQLRTQAAQKRTREDFRREVEKQAAYTLLNRLVILRLMESGEPPMRSPAVVSGGWESRGYKDFRSLAPALVRGDDSEGYAFLLQLVFEDLSHELPGLFGPAGVSELVPVPTATLRHAVEELNKGELESCWTDDMTLGWVYQYWNDPEREALDAKLNGGGKVEPHEVASKTQMFTERYMVDWLLQNSLGPMWLAMCKKHGWTPEVLADGTLERLEQRRVAWRAKRDAGEVSLTELMPLHTEAERHWAYYVPQPIPDGAVDKAPESVRELKILDPAVGSGHFLVVAMGLLVPLYREEARHRGESWTDRSIVERIAEENLHGIDLDPRAVQIAAATLWLKGRTLAPDARPARLNLVASNLRLASLPNDDPALLELRREVERETGIPGELTGKVVQALRGADHLGSLLKVDAAVEEALRHHEHDVGKTGNLFQRVVQREAMDREGAKASLLGRLESFLSKHTAGEDLGLRLRGEQLAAGVRFVRMVREGTYDLVVANPPYQGTSKMAESKYVEKEYPLGKADLYAAFLMRGLELVREGGVSSMLTMRNWMFIKQYAGLRERLLGEFDLRGLGDFDRGSFEDVPDEVVSVAVSVIRNGSHGTTSVALCPTPREDRTRDSERTSRKRAATLCQVGRVEFDPAALKVVPEWPVVYWWTPSFITDYATVTKLGGKYPVRQGLATSDNGRFLRRWYEVAASCSSSLAEPLTALWPPFIRGGAGRQWFEPLADVIHWTTFGLGPKAFAESKYGSYTRTIKNEPWYGQPGVSFAAIGSIFTASVHRYRGLFGHTGSSVFTDEPAGLVCLLNSSTARFVLDSLNPGVHYEVGDVNRLPLFPIENVDHIFTTIEAAFTQHESHREPSVEFKTPGPSPWRQAQAWAQTAVDRPQGAPLPDYTPEYDPEPPTDHISYALGVALGRFGANGEGICDPTKDGLTNTLPAGLLFLDGTLDGEDHRDSLGHPAVALLLQAWNDHGHAIDTKRKYLRDYLRLDFFASVHRTMYENRPIHWPLSSSNKTFVAWVHIHRFTDRTLHILLADHLYPALTRIEGELQDLRAARDGAEKKAARAAEKQLDKVMRARDELATFVADVEQCADRGPLPTDPKCPPREREARYAPDLDDGVMINASALWKLLEPQWKDPKKWWKELATADGKKDYDWARLAMRYFPARVDAKCKGDPSLGVAHGCFWRYHPGRAWAWELRLQDEIGPEFRITEGDDAPHRAAWIRDHAEEALAAVEKEALRRVKKHKVVSEVRILEGGLWSALPEAVWEMELRVSEKQGAEFRLVSPDEAEARMGLGPERAETRRKRLLELVPAAGWFEEGDESDDFGDDAGASEEDEA